MKSTILVVLVKITLCLSTTSLTTTLFCNFQSVLGSASPLLVETDSFDEAVKADNANDDKSKHVNKIENKKSKAILLEGGHKESSTSSRKLSFDERLAIDNGTSESVSNFESILNSDKSNDSYKYSTLKREKGVTPTRRSLNAVNCSGSWSKWTECVNGNRSKTFIVTTQAGFAGQDCDYKDGTKMIEDDCAVDCYGYFKGFANGVESVCTNGKRTRTYFIEREKMNGGKDCDHVDGSTQEQLCGVNCVGEFDNYSACVDGKKFRTYTVTTEAKHGGTACPYSNGNVDEAVCDVARNCVGSWSDYTKCVNNQKTRTYSHNSPATSGGKACEIIDGTLETENCINSVDCVGEFSEWSQCSKGEKQRIYTISVLPERGGDECAFETGYIETQTCKSDCVGNFSEYSVCDKSSGTHKSTYKIEAKAYNGGEDCENLDGDTQVKLCPVDCEGDFGEYSECEPFIVQGVSSRTGFKARRFKISLNSKNNGKSCTYVDGHEERLACEVPRITDNFEEPVSGMEFETSAIDNYNESIGISLAEYAKSYTLEHFSQELEEQKQKNKDFAKSNILETELAMQFLISRNAGANDLSENDALKETLCQSIIESLDNKIYQLNKKYCVINKIFENEVSNLRELSVVVETSISIEGRKSITFTVNYHIELPGELSNDNIAKVANLMSSPSLPAVLKDKLKANIAKDGKSLNITPQEVFASSTKTPTFNRMVTLPWKPLEKGDYKFKKVGEMLKTVSCNLGEKVKFTWETGAADIYKMNSEKQYVSCDFDNDSKKLAGTNKKSYIFSCDEMGVHYIASKAGNKPKNLNDNRYDDNKFGSSLCEQVGMKVMIRVFDKGKTQILRNKTNPDNFNRFNYSLATIYERFIINANFNDGFGSNDQSDNAIDALKFALEHGKDACADFLPPNENSDSKCQALIHSEIAFSYRKRPSPDFSKALIHIAKSLELQPNNCRALSEKAIINEFYKLKSVADALFHRTCNSCGNLTIEMDSIKSAYSNATWKLPCKSDCSIKSRSQDELSIDEESANCKDEVENSWPLTAVQTVFVFFFPVVSVGFILYSYKKLKDEKINRVIELNKSSSMVLPVTPQDLSKSVPVANGNSNNMANSNNSNSNSLLKSANPKLDNLTSFTYGSGPPLPRVPHGFGGIRKDSLSRIDLLLNRSTDPLQNISMQSPKDTPLMTWAVVKNDPPEFSMGEMHKNQREVEELIAELNKPVSSIDRLAESVNDRNSIPNEANTDQVQRNDDSGSSNAQRVSSNNNLSDILQTSDTFPVYAVKPSTNDINENISKHGEHTAVIVDPNADEIPQSLAEPNQQESRPQAGGDTPQSGEIQPCDTPMSGDIQPGDTPRSGDIVINAS